MGFSRGGGRSHFCLSLHLVTNESISMNVFHTVQNPYILSSSSSTLSLGKRNYCFRNFQCCCWQGQAEWQGPG